MLKCRKCSACTLRCILNFDPWCWNCLKSPMQVSHQCQMCWLSRNQTGKIILHVHESQNNTSFFIYQQRSILSAPKTNETKRKERRKEDEKEMHVQILSGPSLFWFFFFVVFNSSFHLSLAGLLVYASGYASILIFVSKFKVTCTRQAAM